MFGALAWLRGDFAAAVSPLEAVTAGHVAAGQHEIDALWFLPTDPMTWVHITWLVPTACAAIWSAPRPSWPRRRAGPNSSASPRARSASPTPASWKLRLRMEAGQLDRAAALAADLTELAERHGFDMWRLAGATQQASIGGLAALAADHPDPAALRRTSRP